MNNKAKNIAICGISAAAATLCLVCCALPGVKWIALILAVLASVCITVPLAVNPKNILLTVLTYIAASVIGVLVSPANITYALPIVAIFMPTAIVKVYGESAKVAKSDKKAQQKPIDGTSTINTEENPQQSDIASTLSAYRDPFDHNEQTQTNAESEKETIGYKPQLPAVVRWILYYVLLELGIAATLLATKLLTPDAFGALTSSDFFIPLVLVAQIVPPLYVHLLSACLYAVEKALRKIVK